MSTHAISRGLMGLSFQGPRGATGFIRFFPSRGAEPSSNLGVCQTSFRACRRFFLLRDRVVFGQIFSSARPRLPFLESATGGACYLLSPHLGRVFFRYPSILFPARGTGVPRRDRQCSSSRTECQRVGTNLRALEQFLERRGRPGLARDGHSKSGFRDRQRTRRRSVRESA